MTICTCCIIFSKQQCTTTKKFNKFAIYNYNWG